MPASSRRRSNSESRHSLPPSPAWTYVLSACRRLQALTPQPSPTTPPSLSVRHTAPDHSPLHLTIAMHDASSNESLLNQLSRIASLSIDKLWFHSNRPNACHPPIQPSQHKIGKRGAITQLNNTGVIFATIDIAILSSRMPALNKPAAVGSRRQTSIDVPDDGPAFDSRSAAAVHIRCVSY